MYNIDGTGYIHPHPPKKQKKKKPTEIGNMLFFFFLTKNINCVYCILVMSVKAINSLWSLYKCTDNKHFWTLEANIRSKANSRSSNFPIKFGKKGGWLVLKENIRKRNSVNQYFEQVVWLIFLKEIAGTCTNRPRGTIHVTPPTTHQTLSPPFQAETW